MTINFLLDRIDGLIKYDRRFKNIKVIRGYPTGVKPTRLDKIYVAVGISEIHLRPSQIDCPARAGDVSFFVDIFVPLKMDNKCIGNVFEDICNILNTYYVMSVSASRVTVDERIQARVMKTCFTFNDQFFGGDDD